MLEKIPLKYVVPKVIFAVYPSQNQVLSVHLRKKAQAGDDPLAPEFEWALKSGYFEVDQFGIPITNLEITGLEEDTPYELKLTHNITLQEYVKEFRTCNVLSLDESPLYMKKIFRGQVLQWYKEGLTNDAYPDNDGGFYYDLSGKFADLYDGYGPMESPLGKNWALKADNYADMGELREAYNCYYLNPDSAGIGKYLGFNVSHTDHEARLPISTIFGGKEMTLMLKVFVDVEFENAKVVSSEVFDVVINADRTISISGSNFQTVQSTEKIEPERWHTFVLVGGTVAGNTGLKSLEVFREENGVTTSFLEIDANFTLGLESVLKANATPLFLGASDGTTVGVAVAKVYLSTLLLDEDSENFRRVSQFYQYLPTLKFAQTYAEGGITFPPGTGFRIGNVFETNYGINANKTPLEIKINYDYTGSANIAFRLNSYLWQYPDGVGVVPPIVESRDAILESGVNKNFVFSIPNDFANHARMNLELYLTTGTVTEESTLQINSIFNGLEMLSLSPLFTATSNPTEVALADGVQGGLTSYVTAELSGSGLALTVAKLSDTEAVTTVTVNDNKHILKIDGSTFMTVIDPVIAAGKYTMFFNSLKNPLKKGEKALEIVDVGSYVEKAGFDIDFGDNFDTALSRFKDKFHANHTQWGGYNGGCNGNLIYASREEKCLRFEQHGDRYTGEVVGVAKPAKNPSFTGYGIPSMRTAPNDPQAGGSFKTRVGSIAVSDQYYGHGEMSVWMRVPIGAYGVCPALWFFHYLEIYPLQDEVWNYWIERGGKPYGGGDPYMVINNEIDIELPSHDTNGTFATWDELQLAYFDPLALDNKYRIGVFDEGGTDPARRGTFQLVDTNNPNWFKSWEKVSEEIQERNWPSYDACKFNNWVGEKSSGNGWGYRADDYAGEEYLALLTRLALNYADGRFHKWTIKWWKEKTELFIDDQLIRTNKAFVPFNVMRFTLGGWFPSQREDRYTPEMPGSWAGITAPWKALHIDIGRIVFVPFAEIDSDKAELHTETYPEAGLREFK